MELIGDLNLLHSIGRFFDQIAHASAIGYERVRPGAYCQCCIYSRTPARRTLQHRRARRLVCRLRSRNGSSGGDVSQKKELKEIGWMNEEVSPYRDYLADFRYEFHDLRDDQDFASCLDPKSYAACQKIGTQLLSTGAAGVVYPSVRGAGGTCIVCFRPPLVLNVQEGPMVTITFINAKVSAVSIQE